MNKVLLVEDEQDLRKIISSYLHQDGFSVTEAADGETALKLFNENSYDLIVLDLMLPKVNGYEVCLEVRRFSKVPIVILTARDNETDELHSFHCGADEYITKPFSPNILLARIHSLMKRCDLLLENKVVIGNFEIDNRQRLVFYEGERIVTTPKEFDLLYYLVNNQNIALTRDQILNAVWGIDYYGDTRTVDTHIKCLRAKLGTFGTHIKTVRKIGYKLETEASQPSL